MLSIRKLMSVVKDVDLEAMPLSIFVNDDDDYVVFTAWDSSVPFNTSASSSPMLPGI